MADQVCDLRSEKRVFYLQCIGWKVSDMYPGDILLKNLIMFTEIH